RPWGVGSEGAVRNGPVLAVRIQRASPLVSNAYGSCSELTKWPWLLPLSSARTLGPRVLVHPRNSRSSSQLSARGTQMLLDELQDRFDRERFSQELLDAFRSSRLAHEVWRCRHSQHRDLSQPRILLAFAQEHPPIHARHQKIQHDGARQLIGGSESIE